MLFDPEDGLPLETIVERLWARKPELHRRAAAVAAAKGIDLLTLAIGACEEMVAQLENDPEAREAFLQRFDQECCPHGFDPRLRPPQPLTTQEEEGSDHA